MQGLDGHCFGFEFVQDFDDFLVNDSESGFESLGGFCSYDSAFDEADVAAFVNADESVTGGGQGWVDADDRDRWHG